MKPISVLWVLPFILLAGCHTPPPLPPPPAALSGASAQTNITTARTATTQASEHCDPVGQGLLNIVLSCLDSASDEMTSFQTQLVKMASDNAETIKQIQEKAAHDVKIADDTRDKAIADSHSQTLHWLDLMMICGGFVGAAGIGLFVYSKVQTTPTMNVGIPDGICAFGGALALSSVALSFVVRFSSGITPYAIGCTAALLIAGTVALIVSLGLWLYRHRNTAIETTKELKNPQPSVPYPPAVEKMVNAIAGPAVALPVSVTAA